MRNLKQTEQRKERLRIRRENEKIENHEKQSLATLKRLKQGDDNELKRNLRLEKVVASKLLRLAVETEEEKITRLENDAAILKNRKLCLSFKLDVLTTLAPTTERNIDHIYCLLLSFFFICM